MNYLHGEYRCKVDAKGRIRLPSELLRQLGGGVVDGGDMVFYVNRGFEKCLMLYSESVWEGMVESVGKLNLYRKEERDFVRYFFRGVSRMEVDGADRLLVGKGLLDYAEVSSDVVLFAYLDRIEVWSAESYEKVLSDEPSEFAELAEKVFGIGDRL